VVPYSDGGSPELKCLGANRILGIDDQRSLFRPLVNGRPEEWGDSARLAGMETARAIVLFVKTGSTHGNAVEPQWIGRNVGKRDRRRIGSCAQVRGAEVENS